MELTSFEKHIGNTILQRGKAYYEYGHVESFEEVENGAWIATVIGSEDYFVEIEFSKRGTVKDYQCDCPYDGDLCKHVVAVLYAIRDEQTIKLNEKQKTSTKRKTKLSFQGLLNKISTDELKAFILQYGKKALASNLILNCILPKKMKTSISRNKYAIRFVKQSERTVNTSLSITDQPVNWHATWTRS